MHFEINNIAITNFILYLVKQKKSNSEVNKEWEVIIDELTEYQKGIKQDNSEIEDINNDIQKIFDLSWGNNNIEQWSDKTVFVLFGLYIKGLIDFDMFRTTLQQLYLSGSIDDFSVAAYLSFSITSSNQIDNIKDLSIDYLSYIEKMREFGLIPLLYSEYSNVIGKITSLKDTTAESEIIIAQELEQTVNNLNLRPQFIEEISKNLSTIVLPYLDIFVDYSKLSLLSYYFGKNVAEQINLEEKISLTTFQEKIEKKFKEKGYPLVPVTYDPYIKTHQDKIETKPLRAAELTNVPPQYMKEFATRKTYSCHKLSQKIKITFLGGGGIGTMAILVQHNNNAILIDYGMSVSNYAIPRWHPALQGVKAVLVTHAHLDHTGALPYLFHSSEGKRWYSSLSTKLLTEKLLFNTYSMTKSTYKSNTVPLPIVKSYFEQSYLLDIFSKFNLIKPKDPIEVTPGFNVTAYPSAHLFGSYGYEIEVFGKRIFFTGDFKLEDSQLFKGAKFPMDSDITIFDGTYYNRQITKEDPVSVIMQAVNRNNKIIVPAFSIGRAQEMFKLFDRLRITKDRKVKLVGLAAEITKNMGIKGNYQLLNSMHEDDFKEGDIVIAGNGMVQGGTARQLVEATKDDPEVGILLCGYQAPSTLGYALKNNHPVTILKYQQEVYFAQISGHSTPKRLDKFINELKGQKIMVHTPSSTKVQPKHSDLLLPTYNQSITIKASNI